MTEYITKEQALETQCEKCPVYNCVLKCSSYTATKNLLTADVVERTEYEKLRLVNLDLAETNKGLLAEHEQLEKLRSKIDKAIEEIENLHEMYNYSYDDLINKKDVLEILKRNIGK